MMKTLYKLAKRFTNVKLMNSPLYRFIRKNFIVSKSVRINGYVLYLDELDSLNLSINKSYEPYETKLFSENIRPGDTVVDIGANIGYYTILASKTVGAAGKVYAFEPDPDNFKLLQKNVLENKCTNVIIEPKAVSDKNGTIKLFVSKSNAGDHRSYDNGDKRIPIDVAAVSLDTYFKGTRINVIKMDVQGYEPYVLDGAAKLISGQKSLILFAEVYPTAIEKAKRSPEKYVKTLQRLGFEMLMIDEANKQVNPFDMGKVMQRYVGELENDANLICIKEV
jgi:FkbM family methyltransferase